MPLTLATSTKFESKKSNVTYNKMTKKNVTKKLSYIDNEGNQLSYMKVILNCATEQHNLLVNDLSAPSVLDINLGDSVKNCITVNVENLSDTNILTLQFKANDTLVSNAPILSNRMNSFMISPSTNGAVNFIIYENQMTGPI